jgi:hypothetical protein
VVRRFIQNAVPLDPSDTSETAKQHPLGYGIKTATSYPVAGRSRIFLPTSGPGFDRIAATIGTPVNGLSPYVHARAWGLLLSSPRAIIEVAVPGEEMLLGQGITPARGRALALRRLVFGSVFHEVSVNDAAEFGQLRVAGVATLTAQMRSQTITEDAWLEVKWFSTTRSLAEHVEPLVDIDSFGATSAAPRLEIIAVEPLEARLAEDDADRLKKAAAAVGFSLAIHCYSAATQSAIEQQIRTNPSSAILIIGSGYGAARIRDVFTASSNSGRIVHIEGGSLGDLSSTVREHFAGLAGIAPSLTVYPPDALNTYTNVKRTRLPVVTPAQCRHDNLERPYVLDGTTGLWWTRDTKGDGGAVFKRYRLEGEDLVHEADVDGKGKDMLAKHKGPTGKTVSGVTLHGCAFPESHLS